MSGRETPPLITYSEVKGNMDSIDEEITDTVPGQRFCLPTNADDVVAAWRQKMEAGILSATHFKDHWRVTVPRLYSPELNRSCLDWSFDEERATALLIKPLEQFMCGGEPGDVLQQLSQFNRPPSICGRVLKSGEPTYSCRECGMDNTCVLCVDCFKRSAHRHHRYKMGQSGGGGCCDCGDTEAWKSDPFCDFHVVGTQQQEESKGLPEDMCDRVSITIAAVLEYCHCLLTMDHAPVLPNDLRLKDDEQDPLQILEQPDCFCTVMYNDETHTFEQVITALTRVIKCTHRDAVEYVTNIDREGRAVVKCSTFHCCSELKGEVENYTSRHGQKSLKVLVMHAHVVAHQIFAMKLLQWLQNFLSNVEGLREIFSQVALRPQPAPERSIAESAMLRDCALWKAARTAWHRLLIGGMLMDYASKKALATLFTKNYASIMQDFIRDDHDHSFSICSLAVQMYTTPTLAHHLVSDEDALFVLLNTFISECSRKCNKQGRLEFERNIPSSFKRAQFILYDVKYLLSSVPKEWTDVLRQGFLHGISLLLQLLAMMQGMDSVLRQVGQHMEFEPEWESAFNLHIKLAHSISLALQWCGTDRVVLAKAYRLTLKKLHEIEPHVTFVVKELGEHSASVIPYDVSTQPVSVHLPLSRFLAGLHLQLQKYDLSFDGTEFQMPKLSPQQIIEPVLRTQAMIAQVHAGMWRRNGYALLNQLYFYQNVKCRPEMFDRDVVLLQMGASLIESNEFILHLLNKFGLMAWAATDYEWVIRIPDDVDDNTRQTINLVEEMLGLLITIIGERHMPGVGVVTPSERIKREIVHQLCVRPMAHSELNRTLPEDEWHETGMETVIQEVAEFKKPTAGQGKGTYSLKPQFYEQYDTFFYHYTREEASRSEGEQRKRRKTAGFSECCPPPLLPRLAPPFVMLANLAQCDMMLHIMHVVMLRSVNLQARSFSETQLHKVLHLMGYALQDEESGEYPFVKFAERAAKTGLHVLLEELSTSARVEAHRELINWTLAKFRSVLGAEKMKQLGETHMETEDSSNKTEETEDPERKRRADMAAQSRAKVMAQMAAAQKDFIQSNAKLFSETDTTATGASPSLTAGESPMEGVGSGSHAALVACRPRPMCPPAPAEHSRTCIMCQEDETPTLQGAPLVLLSFIQQSTVMTRNRGGPEQESTDDPLYLESRIPTAPHVSTCGHVMHGQCWQKYYDNIIAKENRRPYRLRQPASFDIEKQEFLCPLCERLCNAPLPLLPSVPAMDYSISSGDGDGDDRKYEEIPFDTWLRTLKLTLKYKLIHQPVHTCDEECLELHCQASHVCDDACPHSTRPSPLRDSPEQEGGAPRFYAFHSQPDVISAVPQKQQDALTALFTGRPLDMKDDLKDLVHLYTQSVYTRCLGTNPNPADFRASLCVWRAASVTLHATSALLHTERRALLGPQLSSRQRHCLQALIRLISVIGKTFQYPAEIGSHAVRLILAALEGSPLQWDPLGLLVPLVNALPALFTSPDDTVPLPNAGPLSLHSTRLTLMANVTKILITSDYTQLLKDEPMEEQENYASVTFEGSNKLKKLVNELQRGKIDVETLCLNKVWNHVRSASRDFLRGACLYFHFLTDLEPPVELTELFGDTYEVMCSYLGLPITFDGLFDIEESIELSINWGRHEEVDKFFAGEIKVASLREPRVLPNLVDLPQDYSELINAVSVFTCPNSDQEDSKYPTMCLICGEMLCSQTYCCQTELNKMLVGACTAHAAQCGAGVGVFLRVRECEILLLASPGRGCFLPAPYLDQYGETDQGLRRGNPLHLSVERYEQIRLLWLGHGVFERIARSLASGQLMPVVWQHM